MGIKLFQFESLPFETVTDKVTRRYISSDKVTLANLQLEKGAVVPEHQHPNEQISYVTKGSIKVTVNGEDYFVKKGDVILIPPNIPHRFEALEEVLIFDVFTPSREDWIKGQNNPLPDNPIKFL